MKPNEEYVAWDPEKAYRQAGAGTFRLIAVILVILAFGGIWIMGALENQKKTGEVALNTSMAFEEADSLLLDSGYTPLGRIHRSGSSTIRSYDSRILFGCLPAYSTLDTAEGKAENWIRLSHIFEEGGTHSLADPGDICRKLTDSLTGIYGAPEELNSTGDKYLQWKRKDQGIVLLGYMADSNLILCYVWTDSELIRSELSV